MLLAVQGEPGTTISYNIGVGVGCLLPLIFGMMALKTLSAPDRSRKCALSMALLMGGWFLCSLGYAVTSWTGLTWASPLSMFIGGPLGLTAGGLAILGLIEVFGSKKPLRGSWQAIVCLIFVGIFALFGLLGALAGTRERVPKGWEMAQPAPGSRLEVPSKNFSFAVPGGDWVQVVPAKLNAQAELAFLDPKHGMYFMLLAHKLGAGVVIPPEKFLEIARSEITQMDPTAVLGPAQEEKVGPLSGSAFSAEASAKNQPIAYREWVCLQGGFAYQLVAWGPRSKSAEVPQAASRLFKGFEVIVP